MPKSSVRVVRSAVDREFLERNFADPDGNLARTSASTRSARWITAEGLGGIPE